MHASGCTAVAAASSRSAASCAPRQRPPRFTVYAYQTSVDNAAADNAAAKPLLSRRQAAAASLLAAVTWAAPHPSGAAAAADEASKASFYAEWPYVSPSDILPFLRANATPGDIDSVLAAIDRFSEFYPMYR